MKRLRSKFLEEVSLTNLGVQRSDKHEGFAQDGADPLLVGFDAVYAVHCEGERSITQQSSRVKNVSDNHRLEHVQLRKRRHQQQYTGRGCGERERGTSKCPLEPPTLTAVWLPITWAHTIVRAYECGAGLGMKIQQ